MRFVARIVLVLFAVMSVVGQGAGQRVAYHVGGHSDHHADYAHGAHDGGAHHTHEAVFYIGADDQSDAAAKLCSEGVCEVPGDNPAGAHIHVPCCHSVMALVDVDAAVKTFDSITIDLVIDRSSLVLGELRYPLLRPPSLPV
jgi:hypothetical protein